MAFELSKSWFGLGEKTGAMIFVAGAEHTTGLIVRGSNLENPSGFSITSARYGAGLGFSATLTGILIFHCDSLQSVNNQAVNDWGVNFSLGGRWDQGVRSLLRSEQFVSFGRLGYRLRGVAGRAESVRNVLSHAYSIFEGRDGYLSRDNRPKIITFDTPIGGGVEVSANFSQGRITFW